MTSCVVRVGESEIEAVRIFYPYVVSSLVLILVASRSFPASDVGQTETGYEQATAILCPSTSVILTNFIFVCCRRHVLRIRKEEKRGFW